MTKKEKIIKNFNKLGVPEIAQAIRDGHLAIYDLSKAGVLTPLMRRRIEEELARSAATNTVPEPAPEQPRYEQPRREPEPAPEQPRYEQPRREPEPVPEQPRYEQPRREPEPVPEQPRYEQPRREPAPAPEQPRYEQPRREPEPVPEQPWYEQPYSDPIPSIPSFNNRESEDTLVIKAPSVPQVPHFEQDDYQYDNDVNMPSGKPSKPAKPKNDPRINPNDLLDNQGMFRRPFSFKGRIRRTEYGLSILIYVIWYALLIGAVITYNPIIILAILILALPLMWFLWAEGAKRCHDLGHSGWFQLIPFYSIVMLFCEGVRGPNRFGTNPKGY